MLQVHDGQCGMCAHFGENMTQDEPKLIQIRVSHEAPDDLIEPCGLPIGLLPEIDATLVNCDGTEQRVGAAASPPGDARPGWKVLRALGGHLSTPGLDFVELGEWRAHMQASQPAAPTQAPRDRGAAVAAAPGTLERIATVPPYRTDAVLRRAVALNAHPLSAGPWLAVHPDDAVALGLAADGMARVGDSIGNAVLPVRLDARVARGGAWIEACHEATAPLAGTGAPLTIARA